ncbi:MAG: hypothetical protein IIX97_04370 [Clostridia bacterium]|nr:hypothetical protein [Clostridia bacterium]
MIEKILSAASFLAIPIVLLALLGVSIYRYVYAKRKNKKVPDTFSTEEIRIRKLILIVVSAVFGVFAAIVIGFVALMFLAVAYM